MDNADFEISDLTETRTITNEDWDPTVNEVSYRRAEVSLTSNAADDFGSAGRAVGLEFVIRPPLEAGPCPGSGRSNAHG